MKNNLKALGLTLTLSSSMALGPFVYAAPGPAVSESQVTAHVRAQEVEITNQGDVAQEENEEARAWDAYVTSPYTYWDAKVLAKFWEVDVHDGKLAIGRKLLWGEDMAEYLEQSLEEGRNQALGQLETLDFFFDSHFGYEDAEALAEFWGMATPYEGKLKIDKLLILGQEDHLSDQLQQARQR